MSHVAVMCQIHEKLVKGELWAEVTGVTIWGHIKILPGCAKSYETIFVLVPYFILLVFCTSDEES